MRATTTGVRLSRHYLKAMIDANCGRVVFISSESAVNPAPEMAHYSATKLMQLSISRSLAELTKGTRVTVNAILPGSTKTDGVVFDVGWVGRIHCYYNAGGRRLLFQNSRSATPGRSIRNTAWPSSMQRSPAV